MSKKTASILLPVLMAIGMLVLSYLLLPAAGTTAEGLTKPEAQLAAKW